MRELHLDPLYPITTETSASGSGHLHLVGKFLEAGIRFFQVRDKLLEDASLYKLLVRIRQLCSHTDARFIVNDRVDLALASGAAGVHLGQTDLPVDAARRILGGKAVIGISTHNREQFLRAQLAAVDYVALGPIFHSSTKESAIEPLGIESLQELARERRLPLVAIGGINLENVLDVWRAGADSVAVVSDIAAAENPSSRIQSYMDKWSLC